MGENSKTMMLLLEPLKIQQYFLFPQDGFSRYTHFDCNMRELVK